jgi:hypothetical protein
MVILCGCFASFSRTLKCVRGNKSDSQRSQSYRSREYAPESQLRLRSEAPDELGKIRVTSKVTFAAGH